MIELENVQKVFQDPKGQRVVAVDEVSFQLKTGQTLCLIGTSGCGKTTTMKMINRLIEPTQGTIRVGGVEITTRDVIRLRRDIGYVIQTGGLFPHLTVFDNIGLLARLEGWPQKKIRARVEELLEAVHLPFSEYADRYPSELSGGQRQRVGVARALVLDPGYVLMDEPFGALDPITRDQLHQEFVELKTRVKKTIIIVTHDMNEAFKLGDSIALMDQGRIVQLGTEDELKNHPANDFVADFLKNHGGEPV